MREPILQVHPHVLVIGISHQCVDISSTPGSEDQRESSHNRANLHGRCGVAELFRQLAVPSEARRGREFGGLTTSTEHGASRTTFAETLPSSNRSMPVRPDVPTTTSAALLFF